MPVTVTWWILLAAFALCAGFLAFLGLRRPRPLHDLGTISEQWLAQHRMNPYDRDR